mmetsp:Transcript_5614/g.8266  ORF Transcript_5614/g.8266 Transcript_5614/m.8266 type:complete len:263 (+) Transcript_5614:77-865(+)
MEKKKTSQSVPWYASALGGGLGGIAAGLVGHPLDSIKVRLQSGAKVQGSLLRGLPAALGVQLTTTALLFGFYDGVKRRLPQDVLYINFFAGLIAGAMLAPATCWLEMIKCRAQANSKGTMRLGLTATALRCGVGNAAFFHVDATDLCTGIQAGLAYWLIALPFDSIKSLQQVHGLSMLGALRSLSLNHLLQAYIPALARAVPTSAACFLSVHTVRNYFTVDEHSNDHLHLPPHDFIDQREETKKRMSIQFSTATLGRRTTTT